MEEPSFFFPAWTSTRTASAWRRARRAERLRDLSVSSGRMRQVVRLLAKAGDPSNVSVVHEAGPTGFALFRELRRLGYGSEMVAPSLIPQRAGDRIKNDGVTAAGWPSCHARANLRRSGCPMRHTRASETCAGPEKTPAGEAARPPAAQVVPAASRSTVSRQASWIKTHLRWVADQRFDHAGETLAMTEYLLAVEAAQQRVGCLTKALLQIVASWRFAPAVAALRRSLRGVDSVTAIGLIAEIGDFERSETGRNLTGYLGLVPSEHSRGDTSPAS